MNNWISVNEKLPNEWDHVFVCNSEAIPDDWNKNVSEAMFAPCGRGCCDPKFETKGLEYISHEDVTHWMPLPELPTQ